MSPSSAEKAPASPPDASLGSDATSSPEKNRSIREIPKVFGEEVIQPEDIKAMSREVSNLLADDRPDSALQAARQLAHLRRARISIGDPQKQESVNKTLGRHLDAFRERPELEQAQYLGYLKSIGAIKEVANEDKERLQLAAVAAQEGHQTNDLARLSVWNKYLGITDKVPAGAQKELQQSLQQQANHLEQSAGTTLALGRLKYLGISDGLSPDKKQAIKNSVDGKIDQHSKQGRWPQFTRLRNITNYAFGSKPVTKSEQTGIIGYLKQNKSTRALAEAIALTRRVGGEDQVDESFSTRETEVTAFLATLEIEHGKLRPEDIAGTISTESTFGDEHVLGKQEKKPTSLDDTAKDLAAEQDTAITKKVQPTPTPTQPAEAMSSKGVNIEQAGAFGTGVISTETFPEEVAKPEQPTDITVEHTDDLGGTVVSTEVATFPETLKSPETGQEEEAVRVEVVQENKPANQTEKQEAAQESQKRETRQSTEDDQDTPGFIHAFRTVFSWFFGAFGKLLTWIGKISNPK